MKKLDKTLLVAAVAIMAIPTVSSARGTAYIVNGFSAANYFNSSPGSSGAAGAAISSPGGSSNYTANASVDAGSTTSSGASGILGFGANNFSSYSAGYATTAQATGASSILSKGSTGISSAVSIAVAVAPVASGR